MTAMRSVTPSGTVTAYTPTAHRGNRARSAHGGAHAAVKGDLSKEGRRVVEGEGEMKGEGEAELL